MPFSSEFLYARQLNREAEFSCVAKCNIKVVTHSLSITCRKLHENYTFNEKNSYCLVILAAVFHPAEYLTKCGNLTNSVSSGLTLFGRNRKKFSSTSNTLE